MALSRKQLSFELIFPKNCRRSFPLKYRIARNFPVRLEWKNLPSQVAVKDVAKDMSIMLWQ